MDNDCVICSSQLEYLDEDVSMECVLCKKTFKTKTRCVKGHFVCDTCHMKDLNKIIRLCLDENSTNPIEIINKIMSEDYIHMHGPEHHCIVGASLLTSFYNAGGDIDLEKSLIEMINRSSDVPGGICGFWGACGAAISTGIFISIITGSTPLTKEAFSLSNAMTSRALSSVSEHGGPRCCKRDSYLSILSAIDFVNKNFDVKLEKEDVKCNYSEYNNECLKKECPFYLEK